MFSRSWKALRFLSPCALWLALAPAALAQPPFQVVDLNTTEEREAWALFLTRSFASLGGDLYFTVDDGVHGLELWKTDGTGSGTALVKDVCPGACGSLPRALTRAGSRILFFAEDGEHGRELWATDGTAAGTSLVKDVRPGLGSGADTFWMLEAGGTVYFPASDGLLGQELWKSDGTAAGTVLVKDLRPGPEGSQPEPRAAAGGLAILSADDGVHGREPWLTDGTEAGTRLLKDVQPGSAGSAFEGSPFGYLKDWIATADGLFLFQADDGPHGPELWASDGTEAGTILVRDFHPGATGGQPIELTELADTVYFSVDTDAHGYELWRTDGTPAGTSLVKDIRTGGGGSGPREIIPFAGRLVFWALGDAHGRELWASDGTEAGTVLVKDIRPGPGSSALLLQGLTNVAGQLLFFADGDGDGVLALWKSDGTEAGTVLVTDFGGQAFPTLPLQETGLLALGGRFYFRAFDPNAEVDLWASDGTADGTVLVADASSPTSSISILPWDGGAADAVFWGALDGRLIYTADDGTSGNEPWVSDGTAAGTEQLAETVPGIQWSNLPSLASLGSTALFSSGPLWTTNGTPAGTDLLFSSGGPDQVSDLIRIGGTAFFSGATAAEGQELWRSEGTAAGTALVRDVLPGAPGSGPSRLTAVHPRVFFVANGGPGDRNRELWVSDGTADGTVLVEDIRPGAEPSGIDHLTPVAGRLFFTADDGASGREPWVSDGTAAGTFRVKDLLPGPGSSVGTPVPGTSPGLITAALGSAFFFAAGDGLSGEELWATDGTEAGTRRVRDVRPGPGGSEPRGLTVAGGRLFFTADDGTHGRELWVSDGTEAGTVLAADLQPGAGSSLPRELAAAGNAVVFSADDGLHGVEPWASDGTWARRLGDVAPGALPSSPVRFTPAGENVYFGANDGTTGFELWAVPQSALAGPLDFYTVTPCRLADTRPGAPLLTNQPRSFSVAGSCGIPAEARAVAVNLTAVAPNGPGFLVAWPFGGTMPGTSSLSYDPGVTRSNNGAVELGAGGLISVQGQTVIENGQVHFVLDVVGYFR